MIDVSDEIVAPPLRHPWRTGIAMGRAFELLRADAQQHLTLCQRNFGYRYCRFHGLFHDDIAVVVRQPSGALAFQWSHVDKVFDFLKSIGLRPFVELGPMPKAMASGDQEFFHWRMNVTPPADWDEWGVLIRSAALHWIERYGLEEVRSWKFEVWNEPNLPAFWSGTQDQYWKLYEVAARALKSVDPQLSVGGPASAEAGWIPEFVASCDQSGAPYDFISTHAYPQNEFADFPNRAESPHAPGEYFTNIVKKVRGQVSSSKPIYWTEWSSLDATDRDSVDWYANETIDDLSGAACVVRNCLALDADADGLFWWVASDIFEDMGLSKAPFPNTYGLAPVRAIPKPSFHAFRFLSLLTGPRLGLALERPHAGAGAVATREGDSTRLLVWNHVPPGSGTGVWEFEVRFPRAEGKILSTLQVTEGAGSAYETWRSAGRTQNLTRLQFEALQSKATPAASMEVLAGSSVHVSLSPGEVMLLELARPPDPEIEKGVDPQTGVWKDALNVENRV